MERDRRHRNVDYAGALDTLERRADYLSRIVRPEPGSSNGRAAHWRDEAELKSLRLGISCIRERRDRSETDKLLVDAIEAASEHVDDISHPRTSRLLSDALRALEKGDD